ncbi:MAG: glycosyltransferase family 4 protein [Sumerlaeia bacterium]
MKVLLSCTGVGIMTRGIETFARECFDGLHGMQGLNIKLVRGRGEGGEDEIRVRCIRRDNPVADRLAKLTGRNGYVVEQLSSLPAIIKVIREFQPDVVFSSEANLLFQLYKRRAKIGVPYRTLFSNGGPTHPPFVRRDHVQQVAPFYLEEALEAGEPEAKHTLVPYGIKVPSGVLEPVGVEEKAALRKRLGLPGDRPVVLSVGWISTKSHKRPQYLIREMAKLGQPRPFLMMLGHLDEDSETVLAEARDLLGEENFLARSVPYEEVNDYYRCSDVFALASLSEGFGRVYLEAMINGLPIVCHDHPVMRYVVGDGGHFGDFNEPEGMAPILRKLMDGGAPIGQDPALRESVRKRFSWETLQPRYLEMFHRCAAMPLPA